MRSTTHRGTGRRAFALCLVGAPLLLGCAGGREGSKEASQPGFSLPVSAKGSAPMHEPADGETNGAETGFCSKLSRDEIEAAFGRAVSFGTSPSRQDENMCVYSIENDGGMRQFAFGKRRIEDLENIERNYRDSSTPFEPIEGLGMEAFLVNEAQLEIRIDEASAVTLAATILVFGAEPPVGKEQVRAGLIELGRKLIGRL